MRWEKLICAKDIMELADEPFPDVAPWPSSVSAVQSMRHSAVARCLRVRFKAIQDFLAAFRGHPIIFYANLWMDQHAPLMLALEKGIEPEPDPALPQYSPLENYPYTPQLPPECTRNIPLLWTSRSATCLKNWPILKILWKAAPRRPPACSPPRRAAV